MSSSFNLIIRYKDGETFSYTPLASELEGMIFSKWFYEKNEEEFKKFFKKIDKTDGLSPDSSYGIAVIDFVKDQVHDCQRAAELSYVGSAAFSLVLNHKMSDEFDLVELIKNNTFQITKTPNLKTVTFDTKSVDEWKKRTLKGHFLVFLDKPFEFNWYHPEKNEEKTKMYTWMVDEKFSLTEQDHNNWKSFIEGEF